MVARDKRGLFEETIKVCGRNEEAVHVGLGGAEQVCVRYGLVVVRPIVESVWCTNATISSPTGCSHDSCLVQNLPPF